VAEKIVLSRIAADKHTKKELLIHQRALQTHQKSPTNTPIAGRVRVAVTVAFPKIAADKKNIGLGIFFQNEFIAKCVS